MNRTTDNKDNRLDRLLRQVVPIENAERGQMLLIMAFAMVGLLVAVGLAVDGGVLFARKAQLDRAADAAALVGVVEYADPTVDGRGELESANTRARQFLGANGIFVELEAPEVDCDTINWDSYDFCGEVPDTSGSIPGTVRYGIEVRWESEVYFMQLIGFDTIPIRSKAVAEYFPLVDIFTSPTAENGLIRVSNLSIFGPDGCAWFGDPRTPDHLADDNDQTLPDPPGTDYDELNGIYTFRLTVPASFYEDAPNGKGFTQLRVELFDPDSGNQMYHADDNPDVNCSPTQPGGPPHPYCYNEYQVFDQNGIEVDPLSPCEDQENPSEYNDQINACLIDTGQDLESGNPFWIIRVDESRNGYYCSNMNTLLGDYDNAASGIVNTATLYRLYYYQQTESGGLEEVDLAYYVGKADESAATGTGGINPVSNTGTNEYLLTDLMWVSPGTTDLAPLFDWRVNENYVVPNSNILSAAEPTTLVEDCDAARAWITAPSRKGTDIIKATSCAPSTDHNFTINLPNNANNEVPDIFIDPTTGSFDIFLQVIGISGSSENAYEIWAGPTQSELVGDPDQFIPAEVNARNMYYMAHQDTNPHSSEGVTITGLGHLNMNYNSEDPAELPLAYLGPQFAGANMTIRLFDPDGGMGPIIFYMDSIPQSDWVACFEEPTGFTYDPPRVTCDDYFGTATVGHVETLEHPIDGGPRGDDDNTNGRWLDMGPFTLPGDTVPFYGGRLMVHYQGSANDTINWMIVIESRPLLVE